MAPIAIIALPRALSLQYEIKTKILSGAVHGHHMTVGQFYGEGLFYVLVYDSAL